MKRGYCVIYESSNERLYIVHDFGRIDITDLVNITKLDRDCYNHTAVISGTINTTVIDDDE